jgi:hypothetical protein
MPKIISTTQANRIYLSEVKIIERILFRYPSSKADQRFFKMQIMEWLANGREKTGRTWAQLLINMVFARNNSGKEFKYCYYNKAVRQVCVLPSFETWANHVATQINAALNKINGN